MLARRNCNAQNSCRHPCPAPAAGRRRRHGPAGHRHGGKGRRGQQDGDRERPALSDRGAGGRGEARPSSRSARRSRSCSTSTPTSSTRSTTPSSRATQAGGNEMVSITRAVAGAALCVGLGATAAFADAAALEKFPGAKDAIMSYYAANGREPNCGAGQMSGYRQRQRGERERRPGGGRGQLHLQRHARAGGTAAAAATTCASSPSPRVARAGGSAA